MAEVLIGLSVLLILIDYFIPHGCPSTRRLFLLRCRHVLCGVTGVIGERRGGFGRLAFVSDPSSSVV